MRLCAAHDNHLVLRAPKETCLMNHVKTFVRAAVATLAFGGLLAACGGGGHSSGVASVAGGASGPGIQSVSGVSTPESVSVVTATNAQ
jgi:hypothetical protein